MNKRYDGRAASLGWTRSETRRSEGPRKWEGFQRRSKNAGSDGTGM